MNHCDPGAAAAWLAYRLFSREGGHPKTSRLLLLLSVVQAFVMLSQLVLLLHSLQVTSRRVASRHRSSPDRSSCVLLFHSLPPGVAPVTATQPTEHPARSPVRRRADSRAVAGALVRHLSRRRASDRGVRGCSRPRSRRRAVSIRGGERRRETMLGCATHARIRGGAGEEGSGSRSGWVSKTTATSSEARGSDSPPPPPPPLPPVLSAHEWIPYAAMLIGSSGGVVLISSSTAGPAAIDCLAATGPK